MIGVGHSGSMRDSLNCCKIAITLVDRVVSVFACLDHLSKQPAQQGLCRFFRSIKLRVLRLGFFQGDFTGPR